MVDETVTPRTFYVYTHARPDGRVFYIGKGCDRRAYDFSPSRRTLHHRNIMEKYGRENITVTIIPAPDEATASLMEIRYIADAKANGLVLVNITNGGEGASGHIANEAQQAALAKGRGSNRALSDEAKAAILEGLARGRSKISYETQLKNIRAAIDAPRIPKLKVCVECGKSWFTKSGKAQCCSRKCEQTRRRRKDKTEWYANFQDNLL